MVEGSLRRVFLRKDRHLDHRKKFIIAMDAAFGMEYLHSKNIVHFDIKCDNLLVNMKDPSRPICKVSRLQEQLQTERDLRTTLEAGFIMSSGLVSGSCNMDPKTRTELEEIALAEADVARLKQKLAELHQQLHQRRHHHYGSVSDRHHHLHNHNSQQ